MLNRNIWVITLLGIEYVFDIAYIIPPILHKSIVANRKLEELYLEKYISDENIELPKIKQEQSYQNISNEEFVKRLNKLKNK